MVSTVTTATVSSLTSLASATAGQPGTLALFALLALVALLVQKEALGAAGTGWQRAWHRGLDVALAPLALAGAVIAAANLAAVLR